MSKFKCPKCGAKPGEHGKGGPEACHETSREQCQGVICECADEGVKTHGEVASDPCPSANCYHCGWGGTLPHEKAEDPIKLLKEVIKKFGYAMAHDPKLLDRLIKRVKQG